MAIEPVFSYYSKSVFAKGTTAIFYGGHLYFWLPNSNENLFLKTGILYSQIVSNVNYIQIPLQFEYVYPYKVVKPKFDIGLNWLVTSDGGIGLTTLVGGGCYIKMTNFLYLNLDISSDLFHFSYETNFFTSFSTSVGLYFVINNKNYR